MGRKNKKSKSVTTSGEGQAGPPEVISTKSSATSTDTKPTEQKTQKSSKNGIEVVNKQPVASTVPLSSTKKAATNATPKNAPQSKLSLKDLLSTMTKASDGPSQRPGVSSEPNDDAALKRDLAAMLQNTRVETSLRNSALAGNSLLSNKEALGELMQLLSASQPKSCARLSAEEEFAITESLLNSTTSARKVISESEESNSKEGSCELCKKEATTKCTGCRRVFYCSRTCQKNHWTAHKDICRPYKIGKLDGFGKVLVATRAINSGEEILREKPFVVGPRTAADDVCLTCYRRISEKYRCPRCRFPMCGDECAKSSHHSVECEAAQNKGIKELQTLLDEGYSHQNELIIALRCFKVAANDPEKWRTLMDRFGTNQLSKMQRQHLQQNILAPLTYCFDLAKLLGTSHVDNSHVQTVLSVLQCHSLPTQSSYGEVIGVFPMASLLGPSCVPNTKTKLQNDHLSVIATENISSGTHLTALYTDIFWGTKARREQLLQTKNYSCNCKRCEDPTELGTFCSALICPKCPSGNPVLPINSLDSSGMWSCSQCQYQVTAEEVTETTLSLGSDVAEALQNPSKDNLESLLDKWLKRVHTNHYHLHAVKHTLVQFYASSVSKEKDKDKNYWAEISKKEKICQEFLKVCSLLDPAVAHSVPQFALGFYELHKTVTEQAKRKFGLAAISPEQFKKNMLLGRALLRKSMDILRDEPDDSPEGELYAKCEEDFIAVGKWMLGSGLM